MTLHFSAVAQGVDILSAGLQSLIGDDATVDGQAGFLGQGNTRTQADSGQHHVGLDTGAVGQLGDQLIVITVVHRLGQRTKLEGHAQIRQTPADCRRCRLGQ